MMSKEVVTDINGEEFITLRLEDDACTVLDRASIRSTINKGVCFIPYPSSEALRQVSAASPATVEQCKNRVYGILTAHKMKNAVKNK